MQIFLLWRLFGKEASFYPMHSQITSQSQSQENSDKSIKTPSIPVVFNFAELPAPTTEEEVKNFIAALSTLNSITHQFEKNLHQNDSNIKIPPITVSFGKENPMAEYQKAPGDRGSIILVGDLSRPQQLAFQYAHEMVHTLVLHTNKNIPKTNFRYHSNSWLEESLAEVGSLYSLRALEGDFRSYSDLRKKSFDQTESKRESFEGWFKRNQSVLRKNPIDRKNNFMIAEKLLPLFEADPKGWGTLPYLSAQEHQEGQSLESYMTNWYQAVPSVGKVFVKNVAEVFGIKLKSD
jgi:hypothetical protein